MFPAAFRKVKEKTYAAVKTASSSSTVVNNENYFNADGTNGNGVGAQGSSAKQGPPMPGILSTKPLTLTQAKDVDVVRLHLKLCTYVYDFNKEYLCVKEKEAKRALLIGLIEYISFHETVVDERLVPDIMLMISNNLFRPFPPSSRLSMESLDDEEPRLEKAWPHLQIVYEFLLRFVVSKNVNERVMKKYITLDFVANLLPLFDSEDVRERDYLKNVLHRIYGKYMAHRTYLRQAIKLVFFSVIYENENHNGIAELLEILGSIINGFALPLKEEHKNYLIEVLVPLHKVKGITCFHQQLMYCINQYVEKDATLAEPVVMGMLKHWPITNSPKQILFLYEIEDVLEITHQKHEEVGKFIFPLFQRIQTCLDSCHFQLVERVLFMWQNDCVLNVINHFRKDIIPLVMSRIKHIASTHWNQTVVSLANDVVKLYDMMEVTTEVEGSDDTMSSKEIALQKRDARLARWDQITPPKNTS